MSKKLEYDIFLSYSSQDKQKVKQLAENLHDDGVCVWFDEWEIEPGDDIFSKMQEGISLSRILVLIMSPNAFGSDWVSLESNTVIFRDPMNKERRFIPVLIENCEIPDTIRRYKYIDLRKKDIDSYIQLLEICRAISKPETYETLPTLTTFERKLIGHPASIRSVIISPDGNYAISGSFDNTIKLWNITTGECTRSFIGHLSSVYSVAVTSDGKRIISGSDDNTIKLWDLKSGKCKHTFKGHDITVRSVAIIEDKNYILSGSIDKTLKLWDLRSGDCLNTFIGHDGFVHSVAITPDRMCAISGSSDKTIKLWDLESGNCIGTLEGHDDYIFWVAATPCEKRVLSGSGDKTLKLWDLSSKRCIATFEGHTGRVYCVAISPDGKIAASASQDFTVKLWDLETGACLQTLKHRHDSQPWNVAFNPNGSNLIVGTREGSIYIWRFKDIKLRISPSMVEDQIRYTNAKIVLVGESGVGKTSLAYRLAENRWEMAPSTHGMKVSPLKLSPLEDKTDIQREVLLWDLAGQPNYRLTHHLFLDDTALALVVFDPSNPYDPFEGIGDWEKTLRTAVGYDPIKLLVAARSDRGGATITRDKIDNFIQEHGYTGYFSTSAMKDEGCDRLKDSLIKFIPWDKLSWISTRKLFKELKEAIIELIDEGIVLIRFSELLQQLQIRLPNKSFNEQDLRSVIGLLAGQGLLKPLAFGDFILLQPEQLNNYASGIILAAREHIDGIGCILEQDVIESNFKLDKEIRLQNKKDEEILLRFLVQIFIDHSLCIREETEHGVLLVFPSQFNREIPDIPDYPNIIVTYCFSGQLETIYATLVVRLAYSISFLKKDLWKNAAEFFSPANKKVGFKMNKIGDGRGEIKVFFDSGVSDETRVIFIKYIHEHLLKRAVDVERKREYVCHECNYPVTDRKIIERRLNSDRKSIFCLNCGAEIELVDLIEQNFDSEIFMDKVKNLDENARINIDKESRELILVGHASTISAESGQLFHPYPQSDYGIDGEIEFINNKGKPSAKKIYLQLRYENSYTYRYQEDKKEGKYDKETFTVKNKKYYNYWQSKDGPVYLVIRSIKGEIQWMDITEYLKRFKTKSVGDIEIEFSGKPFNYSNLMELRDKHILKKI
jgi:WD40 repeat protein